MSRTSSNRSEIFSPVTTPAFLHLIEILGSKRSRHTLGYLYYLHFFDTQPTCPIRIKPNEYFCPRGATLGTRDPIAGFCVGV
jgi:hypothetical protein